MPTVQEEENKKHKQDKIRSRKKTAINEWIKDYLISFKVSIASQLMTWANLIHMALVALWRNVDLYLQSYLSKSYEHDKKCYLKTGIHDQI